MCVLKNLIIWIFRPDFRLLIADPNYSDKIFPHLVVWFSDTKIIKAVISKTTITYFVEFKMPLSGWQGFLFRLSFPDLDGTVLEVCSLVSIWSKYYSRDISISIYILTADFFLFLIFSQVIYFLI